MHDSTIFSVLFRIYRHFRLYFLSPSLYSYTDMASVKIFPTIYFVAMLAVSVSAVAEEKDELDPAFTVYGMKLLNQQEE